MSAPPANDRFFVAYSALQQRVAEVVRTGECHLAVPACPGWTVHDVVAHLTGLCQDWVDGRLDKYASDAWTAGQVARFSASSCDEILGVWSATVGAFGALTEPFLGQPPSRWAFGDAVVHEADIKGALGSGRVPLDAVRLGLRGSLARWEHEVLRPAGLLPLDVRTPDSDVVRLGEQGGAAATVEVETYELFRALAGRRTASQVRRWEWSADPEPWVAAGLPIPFTWASLDLVD